MNEVICKEVAQEEFYRWVSNFGYSKEDFQEGGVLVDHESMRDKIVKAVMDGKVTVSPELTLTQALYSPVKTESESIVLDSITYRTSYKGFEYDNAMKGIDFRNEPLKMNVAMASMLTGKGRAILGQMDSKDYKIMQAVVSFFQL